MLGGLRPYLEVRASRQMEDGSLVVYINSGMATVKFNKSGGVYSPNRANGAQLVSTTVSGLENLEYISRDGMHIKFVPINTTDCANTSLTCNFRATSLIKPNNDELIFSYDSSNNLRSVNTSLGWNASFQYNPNNRIISVQLVNRADSICGPAYGGPGYCDSSTSQQVTFAYEASNTRLKSAIGNDGQIWSYTYDSSSRLFGISRPASGATYDRTIYYNASNKVSSLNRHGYGTWYYTYTATQTDVRDPLNNVEKAYFGSGDQPLWMEDGLGRRTAFVYDTNGRLTKQTNPEGDFVQFTYDARGNVTQTLRRAKAGSGLADIITTAGYPTSCSTSDAGRCNKPLWTRDAKGQQTDYTYNTSSNGPATITFPAGENGVRPQQRFTYQALYAYIRTGISTYVQGPRAVYRMTEVKACQTLAICSGGADEVKTVFGYGATGVGNNRAVQSVIQDAGGLNLTTTTSYDRYGDISIIDGPLSGASDSTYFHYDNMRRPYGGITPDPDGAGSLKYQASRMTYNIDGQPTIMDFGTVTGTTYSAVQSLSIGQSRTFNYDSAGRVVTERFRRSVTDYSVWRCDKIWLACRSDACTLGTEATSGKDQITRSEYDAAGQAIKLISAYGVTGLQQDTITTTYTTNGQVATVRDAKGNLTSYLYDGFDRLVTLRYPHKTTIGASSTTDYESYSYDANGNVTSLRERDGRVIAFLYDALNRLTKKDLPSTTADDVYYAYDLLGRTLSARYGSTSGSGIINVYDKAGRLTSTSSYGRTLSYLYDAASRRTRMTHPDGFWVQYDYDLLDRVTKVREYGASSGAGLLASYSYDDRGRRTSITRGNGVTTSYGYDAVSRLESLSHDLSGTTNDYAVDFTYSPASQLLSRFQSNDTVYAWTGQTTGTVSGAFNGLNQPTALGGKTITHDANGNVTGDGTSTFTYDVENKLTQVSGGSNVSFAYDPLGRLRQVTAGAATQFLYDGADLVVEYSSTGTVLRRYVHGPGVDEPLVWYEGSTTSTRKWLHTDERGSVVAVTNASGVLSEAHNYGPYGEQGSFAGVRFQYTGQIILLKARSYFASRKLAARSERQKVY